MSYETIADLPSVPAGSLLKVVEYDDPDMPLPLAVTPEGTAALRAAGIPEPKLRVEGAK
jgi:hypothetical protein